MQIQLVVESQPYREFDNLDTGDEDTIDNHDTGDEDTIENLNKGDDATTIAAIQLKSHGNLHLNRILKNSLISILFEEISQKQISKCLFGKILGI